MKQAGGTKYQLLKQKASHQRSFGSLTRKTTFIQRQNSSSDFSRTQLFDYKKIEECKSTIQSIVQKISLQNKKNHFLKNLVQLMNQQMISIKEQSKKNEHEQFQQQSKVIKRLNYDIDKTLQKNNEEIANLFRLKQEINAKRSERVVFSNLFRKIQTELKNATNLYIETIIKSETSRNETIFLQAMRRGENEEEVPLTQRNHVLKESEEGSEERNRAMRDSQDMLRSESSVMRKRKFKQQKNVGSRFITQHAQNYDHFEHIQKRISLTNNSIYQLQFEIKRLLQATGCEDFQQAQFFVNNVESENKRLQEELQEMTRKTQELEFEQRVIINKKKNAEIMESLPRSKTRIKNVKSGKVIESQLQPQQQHQTHQQILQQLLTVFNLQSQGADKFIENVSLMDQKLDSLIKLLPSTSRPTTTERQKLERETNQSSAGSERQALPPLNVILERVEPVGDSEKLYEKSWFLDAYQRELKKFNKKEHKKK